MNRLITKNIPSFYLPKECGIDDKNERSVVVIFHITTARIRQSGFKTFNKINHDARHFETTIVIPAFIFEFVYR